MCSRRNHASRGARRGHQCPLPPISLLSSPAFRNRKPEPPQNRRDGSKYIHTLHLSLLLPSCYIYLKIASPLPVNSKSKAPKPTSTSIVPSQQIVQAFKNFLECGKDEQVSSYLYIYILFLLFLFFLSCLYITRFKKLLMTRCGNN